ncbi:hypothetical protein [Ferrovibrio sp.]|uniref:O-linked N-acetylglucosamine transferase, SPINDLY family protein n=1 Tax=Ferrovibrio sp. TaxID=1917215 RepID=UPI003D1428A7
MSEPAAAVGALLQASLAAARAGDLDRCFAFAKQVLKLDPQHRDALRLAGMAATERRNWPIAARYLRQYVRHYPDDTEMLRQLLTALVNEGDDAELEQVFRAVLAISPPGPQLWQRVVNGLLLVNRTGVMRRYAEEAQQLFPDLPDFDTALAIILVREGRLDEARVALRRIVESHPHLMLPHTNLLFCLNYDQTLTPEQLFDEYRRFDERHGRPYLPQPLQHGNSRDAARRLKVGYVSGDFRQHVVPMFFEPVLRGHDRRQVEIYLYAEVPVPDAVTERLKSQADHWRSIIGKSDDSAAAMIRRDGIDILVDLSGHTAGNRLGIFARKPAPVQFSYLIGAGYTTGLSAIDGFFTDDYMVPPGFEHLFSERLVRLGRSPLAYMPPDFETPPGRQPVAVPDIGPLPALRNGHVTFGCFSRAVRINDGVIALWARLMQQVPGSRLVLNNRPFADAATQKYFLDRFAAHGIAPERLDLIFTTPQIKTWACYNEIDIALDPFPHNAGTTTIEALWMGVPVLSKTDRPSVGRFGASILGALGMSDWVADSAEQLVATGAAKAADIAALAELRAGLRARFEASPMRDGAGLARAIEAGFRQLWREWCASGGADA